MMLTTEARGVYPIAPTPFFDDGTIARLADLAFYVTTTSTGAVIANAIHDALGVRLFELPMTPARIIDQAMPIPSEPLAQAEATLANAQTQFDKADLDVRRFTPLAKSATCPSLPR